MMAEFPCGCCSAEVVDDDQAVQCEGNCSFWFHCKCGLGLTLNDKQYRNLSQSQTAWTCSNCTGDFSLSSFNCKDAVDVFHFDFQKNIPTPKLTVGKQFYMRLLWTYLFGIFNASTNTMCALMWNELIAHRGANDVVSSLAHFIFNTRSGRTGAKHSIWWADNCPGQNKNHCVVWFFQDLVRQQVYSRIDYKFLVVGHTYGPTDRFFGVIENHLKKIENVYTPQEWYCHVQSSSTSIEVIEMKQEFFCDYWSHLRLLYTEHKDVHGKPVDFSKAIWFNFGEGDELLPLKGLVKKKHPDEVWVRYSYDPHEMPQKVCYMKNNFDYVQHSPDRLYKSAPIPIKKAKAADLKRLANDYVPRDLRNMYLNLPTTAD